MTSWTEGKKMKEMVLNALLLLLIFCSCMVATSIGGNINNPNHPSEPQSQNTVGVNAEQGIGDQLKQKKTENRENGRVIDTRRKRDLLYIKQLERLMTAVENALEQQYGVTMEEEPYCLLKATCEIYRKNANGNASDNDKNFITLAEELRKELKNPRVVPLAKYVFEYFEEAAVNGEKLEDCTEKYSTCPYSLD